MARALAGFFVLLSVQDAGTYAQNRVQLPSTLAVEAYQPGTTWTPAPGGSTITPGPALGGQIQPFDPYAGPSPGMPSTGVFPPLTQPMTSAPPPSAPWNFPPPNLPPSTGTAWPNPTVYPPAQTAPTLVPTYPPAPGYAPPGYPPPVYPPNTPQQPVFPEGFQPERLFQDTGAVYTWLYGDNGDELQINEVDIFTTLVLKYFADPQSGLRLTPGFTFDFLDGPKDSPAELPGQLYAAYLNSAWKPQFSPQFGGDINFRAGVYSDFETVTADSVRFTGRGLGIVRFSPTVALKAGVEYLDRVDIKLLPAGGILWEPNPQTRFDFYFPRPRLSKYWTTWGNTDVWWHLGGEYGGGSWTVDQGLSQRVDINDIRVFVGIDWDRLNGMDGLFEVGYVFNREIIYEYTTAANTDLADTFMLRLGLQF